MRDRSLVEDIELRGGLDVQHRPLFFVDLRVIARDRAQCERIASELMGGSMEQTYVRGRLGYVILNAVGTEALLIVLTTPDAKLGLVFLDVKRRVQELARLL